MREWEDIFIGVKDEGKKMEERMEQNQTLLAPNEIAQNHKKNTVNKIRTTFFLPLFLTIGVEKTKVATFVVTAVFLVVALAVTLYFVATRLEKRHFSISDLI